MGMRQVLTAARSGIPRGSGSNRTAAGFPWTRWADMAVTGACCLLLSALLERRSPTPERGAVFFLAAIFLATGAAKLTDRAGFIHLVKRMEIVPARIADVSWLVGALELATASALLHKRWRRIGAGSAAVMMVGFTAISAYLLASGYTGNCGCLPWRDRLGWWTLARDLGLLSLCAAVLHCANDSYPPGDVKRTAAEAGRAEGCPFQAGRARKGG